jgi:hypothetical protein
MIRATFLALTLSMTLPASAQTPAPATPETVRAARALSAMWRPVEALTSAQIEAACRGAFEEIEAVEAALPPVLTSESVAAVRTLRGLLILPSDDPGLPYFFPDDTLPWFASGLGAVGVIDEAQGFLGVRDAAGRDIALQLGRAAGRGVMLLRDPEGAVLNFVACAPTIGL